MFQEAMSSLVLNPEEKVAASASQKQLSNPRRDRKSSVPPTKAVHLNDKAARRTQDSLFLDVLQRQRGQSLPLQMLTRPPGE